MKRVIVTIEEVDFDLGRSAGHEVTQIVWDVGEDGVILNDEILDGSPEEHVLAALRTALDKQP